MDKKVKYQMPDGFEMPKSPGFAVIAESQVTLNKYADPIMGIREKVWIERRSPKVEDPDG